ncbi:hypothetical protein [Brevundimonas bullata]|uniref:hypothetical protein n=1 Tax=Brevundimonas bullata TaxID=13160 RepID=UPI003D9A71C7
MTIPDFLSLCDDFCRRKAVSRTWLSKRLFSDTYRLQNLAAGDSDVGVKRMEQAVADLQRMNLDTPDTVNSAANDREPQAKAA